MGEFNLIGLLQNETLQKSVSYFVSIHFQNPRKVIREMADHIGVTCSEEFIAEVAKASKFNNVKPLIQSEEQKSRKVFKDFVLYRKGG